MLSTFVDNDYLPNCTGVKLIQILQDSTHFPHFLFCLLMVLCLPNNFIASGVCNSGSYSFFYFKHYSNINSIDVKINRRNCFQCFTIFNDILDMILNI